MGRPLQNCNCEAGSPKGKNCTEALATTYCSGAGYVFSSASLRAMRGKWTSCWNKNGRIYNDRCKSSDTFVGLCMFQFANTKCEAAIINSNTLKPYLNSQIQIYTAKALAAKIQSNDSHFVPTHGMSWRIPPAPTSSYRIHTLLCQDRTQPGGIGHRNLSSAIHLYDRTDRELCAYVHPIKVNGSLSPHSFKYARYIMKYAQNTSVPLPIAREM